MAKSTNHVLNLDEIFGKTEIVKVKWEGKTHLLTSPQELSAKQIVDWERLTNRVNEMSQSDGEEMTQEESDQLEEIVTDAMEIIAPSLPIDKMPFMAKFRLLSWYVEIIAPAVSGGDTDSPKATGEE